MPKNMYNPLNGCRLMIGHDKNKENYFKFLLELKIITIKILSHFTICHKINKKKIRVFAE